MKDQLLGSLHYGEDAECNFLTMLEELRPSYVNTTLDYKKACIKFVKSLADKRPTLEVLSNLREIYGFCMFSRYDTIKFHLRQRIKEMTEPLKPSTRSQKKANGSRSIEDNFVDVGEWVEFPELVSDYMKVVPLEMPVRKGLYLSQSGGAQENSSQSNEVIRLESQIFTYLRENVFLMVSEAVEHTLSQQPPASSAPWSKVEITQAGDKSDYFLPDVFVHYPDATHKKSFLCGELKYLTVDLGMCFNNSQKFKKKKSLVPV